MHTAGLGAMLHDALGELIQRGHQLLRDDHLGEQGVDTVVIQLEHLSQLGDADAVVDVAEPWRSSCR